jgi:hypothetical protein
MTMEVHFTPEQEAQLAQIATKAGTAPERLVKDTVLRLLEGEAHPGSDAPPEPNADTRPIWEVMLDNLKDVPPEEFARLPKDGASQVDHYLYGHPKRNP